MSSWSTGPCLLLLAQHQLPPGVINQSELTSSQAPGTHGVCVIREHEWGTSSASVMDLVTGSAGPPCDRSEHLSTRINDMANIFEFVRPVVACGFMVWLFDLPDACCPDSVHACACWRVPWLAHTVRPLKLSLLDLREAYACRLSTRLACAKAL